MLAPLPQFAPDQLATPADIVGTVHKALHVVSAAEASFPASFVFPAGHDSHLFFTTISLIAQMVALGLQHNASSVLPSTQGLLV